jgi:ubiquinone/menaquinone biosynthesis C-methylase UbiE
MLDFANPEFAGSAMSYAFGDSAVAAERLAVVAEVFEGPSQRFWRTFAPSTPRLALDLGCGPGHTTCALAQSVHPLKTVGIDSSAEFLARAEQAAEPGVRFVRHDVTAFPFPLEPADLVVCRFLLSHLRNPALVLAAWGTLLATAGRLLIEEVESISTDCPVFQRYLALVSATLEGQGQTLYVGPFLDRVGAPPGLGRIASRVTEHRVTTTKAARMFELNLDALGRNPLAREREGEKGLRELAQALRSLSLLPDPSFENRWGLRQLAFERTPHGDFAVAAGSSG